MRTALSFKDVLNSELLQLIPSHFQGFSVIRIDQVENRFIVDLNKGNEDLKSLIGRRFLVNFGEELSDGLRNNAF
jgi:hypothetical protein